ncbi:MAG TPA: cupredoxin domain-containing protein [Dehalococcoidia bacterium]
MVSEGGLDMKAPAIVESKPFWVRVAALGVSLFLALVVVYLVVGLIQGDEDTVGFAAVTGVVGLVALAMVLLARQWSLIVAALLGLFGLVNFLGTVPDGISSPDSFFDFITVTVGIVGLIMLVIGCAVGFIRARSGHASMSGPPTAVLAVRALLVMMLVTGVISAILTVTNKETVSAADAQGAIVITANKAKWSTDTIDSSSSGTLKLLIKNSDPYLHTFTVKDLNMDFKLKPGSEKLIELKSPLAGSHQFMCTIHTDMKGTIEVK